MFSKKDYVPFLLGLFALGGMILIPIIWGGFLGIEYEDAFLPSLISCAVFAHALDQSGHFDVKRFVVIFVIVLGLMSYAAASYTNRPTAMFLAGGFLGYIVMAGCGWAGIFCQRILARRSDPTVISEATLLKRNDIAARCVQGILMASLMIYMVSNRIENQKRNYYKSLFQSTPYQTGVGSR